MSQQVWVIARFDQTDGRKRVLFLKDYAGEWTHVADWALSVWCSDRDGCAEMVRYLRTIPSALKAAICLAELRDGGDAGQYLKLLVDPSLKDA